MTELYKKMYWNNSFVENTYLVTDHDTVLIEFDNYTSNDGGASITTSKGTLKELINYTYHTGQSGSNVAWVHIRYILENAEGATITFNMNGINYGCLESVYALD